MPELVLFRLVPFGYVIIASSSQDFNSVGVRRAIGKLIHLGRFAFSEPVPAHRAQERDGHPALPGQYPGQRGARGRDEDRGAGESVASVFQSFSFVVVDYERQHGFIFCEHSVSIL